MRFLITGGSGTIGRAFIKKYRYKYEFINISRTEINCVKLKRDFPEVKTYLGEIEDLGFLLNVFKITQPDVVIHAAALKHIDLIEKNPIYACRINIVGSLNVINACILTDVPMSLFISTDKACDPISVYGSTKFLMEKSFLSLNSNEHRFSVVRCANIAHSTGSVIPFWLSLKQENKPLLLTNPNMNRLMLTQDDVATTINNVLKYMKKEGGIIGSHKSKSVNMFSLAKLISDDIKIVGNRGSEKLDEDLINESEIMYSYVDNRQIYIKKEQNLDNKTRLSEKYSSKTAEKMSVKEMEEMIWI